MLVLYLSFVVFVSASVPEYSKCNGDRNTTFKECPAACPHSCDKPETDVCTKQCLREGCECNPGYVRGPDNKCIQPSDCPGGDPCRGNQTYVYCKVGCPTNYCPTDDRRAIVACSPPYPCPSGCSCKGNYLRVSQDDQRCILASECPPVNCTRQNEEWNSCSSPCLTERCSDLGQQPVLCNQLYCRPQCVCKKGYYRNNQDICVPVRDCLCQENEHFVENSTDCQKTCGNRLVQYQESCEAYTGCVCDTGFVRPYDNSTGTCVPESQCAPIPTQCGFNEEPSSCKFVCPPQSCEISYTSYNCPKRECEPGCNCMENYLRNSSNICILNDDCPAPEPAPTEEQQPQCGPNEILTDCELTWPYGTCASLYTKYRPAQNNTSCSPSCRCIDNYLRWHLGNCIPKQDCPPSHSYYNRILNATLNNSTNLVSSSQNSASSSASTIVTNRNENSSSSSSSSSSASSLSSRNVSTSVNSKQENNCSGNSNATYKDCPMACPPTCDAPDAMSTCTKLCPSAGCECNPGYILSTNNGTCVLPNECPGGNPCGANRTFVYNKVLCPSAYCPVDDSRWAVACDPPFPHQSGCVCEVSHRILSENEQRCILAFDCPPVKCTRPNEEWNPFAPYNLAEKCLDVGCEQERPDYFGMYSSYDPKCVCKEDFYRNQSDICIPVEKCTLD